MTGDLQPLFVPTIEQIDRERTNASRTEAAARAWRWQLGRLAAGCGAGYLAGVAVAAAGMAADGERLGWALVRGGQFLAVVLPVGRALLWWVDASARGDV
ncbi:MAG: hypothetical protein ACKVZ0_09455 [Gemmatimonadales bacterium]